MGRIRKLLCILIYAVLRILREIFMNKTFFLFFVLGKGQGKRYPELTSMYEMMSVDEAKMISPGRNKCNKVISAYPYK